ncbi:MAG: Unknown protein [uncultured Campylobacterales bacterium]|uniref:Uncharacterized protein n=1 Tax=uncultured Campylobacterales bacterium TaxID=352960 RepID=A0A6S6SQ12_9BACT|nr:MAG: Unknown protein [uncultured Campylobacterales bacterium]
MKNSILKILLLGVFLLGTLNALNINDHIDISKTDAATWTDPFTGDQYKNAFSFSVRFKNPSRTSEPMFNYQPAEVRWGCDGMDFKAAILQWFGIDDIKLLLEDFSVTLVWGLILAMDITVPKLGKAFEALRKMAQDIRKLLSDACSLGKAIGSRWGLDGVGATLDNGIFGPMKRLDEHIAGKINYANTELQKWVTEKTAEIADPDKKADAGKIAHGAFYRIFEKSAGSIYSSMFSKYQWCKGGEEKEGIFLTNLSTVFSTLDSLGTLTPDPSIKYLHPSDTSTNMNKGPLSPKLFGKSVDAECESIGMNGPEHMRLKQKILLYQLLYLLVGDNVIEEGFLQEFLNVTGSLQKLEGYIKRLLASADDLSEKDINSFVGGVMQKNDFGKLLMDGAHKAKCNYSNDPTSPTECVVPNNPVIIYNISSNEDPAIKGELIRGVVLAIEKQKSTELIEWDGFIAEAEKSVQYMMCVELNTTKSGNAAIAGKVINYESLAKYRSTELADGSKVFTGCDDLFVRAQSEPFVTFISDMPRYKRYIKNLAILLSVGGRSFNDVFNSASDLQIRLAYKMTQEFLSEFIGTVATVLDSLPFAKTSTSAFEAIHIKLREMDQISQELGEEFEQRIEKMNKDSGTLIAKMYAAEKEVRELRLKNTINQSNN